MKTNKKTKNEENEYWLDDLLEQPENYKNEPDGSTLYGYDEEPKLFSQGWWLDKKNARSHVWLAKNPFNDKYDRELHRSGLRLFHPDAYRIFFPFTYIWGLISDIIHPEYGTRGNAWYRFFQSSVGEIVLLLIFGLIVCGAAIIFCKLTGIGLA
jgi:hypothetical protein